MSYCSPEIHVDITLGEVRARLIFNRQMRRQTSERSSPPLAHRILASRLRVVALIDPDGSRAADALNSKLRSAMSDAWTDCALFPTIADAAASIPPERVPQ